MTPRCCDTCQNIPCQILDRVPCVKDEYEKIVFQERTRILFEVDRILHKHPSRIVNQFFLSELKDAINMEKL